MQRKAQDRGLLWRIEHRGRTSWLYGTMHAAKLDWSVPGPTVADALRASDSLALELNILDPEVMNVLFAGMQARPDAPPLRGDRSAPTTVTWNPHCACCARTCPPPGWGWSCHCATGPQQTAKCPTSA